ncbi:MAG: hypothetical protein UH239_05990 [Acutalibacteraceae bacterium]|nr:hypothetical protein [Acutalibacteraceae bacterium]
MRNLANSDVRGILKRERIAYWEIAQVLGIHENSLTRWMRTELDVDKKFKILRAVNTVVRKREEAEQ